MKQEVKRNNPTISPVTRTKAQARASYDRLSRFYDLITGGAEQKIRDLGTELLDIREGETVLEIGPGTGRSLEKIARKVGETGLVHGIDISPGMLAVSRRRLEKAGLCRRVDLTCEDALAMPYTRGTIDAVFACFVLELFDTPEIPYLLTAIRSVLKPSGRLGVASMSTGERRSSALRVYEWFHQKLPGLVDCRPIPTGQILQEAGFAIQSQMSIRLWGLPVEVIVATKPTTSLQ
jgi:ubiquinone/menaquinone biosynthesis C-methylase UbiE